MTPLPRQIVTMRALVIAVVLALTASAASAQSLKVGDRLVHVGQADGHGDHQFHEAHAALSVHRHVWNPIWKVMGAASPASTHWTMTT